MSRPLACLERRLEALRETGNGDVGVLLERLLNDGYAHVLVLEAERRRAARRVQELAHRADEPGVGEEMHARAVELAALDEDIRALRELLGRAWAMGPTGSARR